MSKISTIVKLEKRFKDLRIGIISKLQKIKRDAGEPMPFVRIVSNEQSGGHSALILDGLGQWSSKFMMTGYPIKEPSVNNLLEEYAVIADPVFRNATLRGDKPEARKSYLQAMRLQLLRGLVSAMEKALAEISR